MIVELGVVLANPGQFIAPLLFVHRQEFGHVRARHVETLHVDRLGGGHVANWCLEGLAATGGALKNPLEHPGVLAKARPEPTAVVALAKPVDVEDLG